MRTVAIVQGRMDSTRLPGKILRDLRGKPMIARVVERARAAKRIDETVVATTTLPEDDAVERLCEEVGVACFRGSVDDVLDRCCEAAAGRGAEAVVRLTGDCPFLDPEVIDFVVGEFVEAQPNCDYAVTQGFPRGLDTEVIRFEALEKARKEDEDPAWREHVTAYIYNHPERFKLRYCDSGEDLGSLRWTVDTEEDFRFAEAVLDAVGEERTGWRDVLASIEARPELAEMNRHVPQKTVPGDATGA